MGPLHKFSSILSSSVIDLNNNNNKMGVKNKKSKFTSEMNIFSSNEGDRIKTKTYVWATMNNKANKKSKGIEKAQHEKWAIGQFA